MAKTNRGGRRGGGGGGGNLQPTTPTTPTPTTPDQDLINYLQSHTVAYSPEMALEHTNPHYRDSWQYQQNCQRCVWAYELQRRGYDVEALPTYQGDDLPRGGNWRYLANNWSENSRFVSAGYGQSNSVKTEITNITSEMNNWGNGSRAIVRVVWKSGRSGHVFNIENQGGIIKAFDGQTGKEVGLKDYLSRAKRGYTSIIRTDNADINLNAVSRFVKIRER